MSRKIMVLQHGAWEGPGIFLLETMNKNKVVYEIVEAWRQPLPADLDFDALIVLGGSPNVDQEEQYPFLRAEKNFIRKVLAADRPYFGFCLGHQLLADAFGAEVKNNVMAGIGFVQGHLTHHGREHPVFKGLPKKFPLFKWHGQAVQNPLPKNLVLLVTSSECQVEGISVVDRPHIVGIQFDNHAAATDDVALFLRKDQRWLSSTGRNINPDQVIADSTQYGQDIAEQFDTLFSNFLSLL